MLGGAGALNDSAWADQPREVEGAGAADDWAAADQPREVEGAAAEKGEEEVGPALREMQGPTPPLCVAGLETGGGGPHGPRPARRLLRNLLSDPLFYAPRLLACQELLFRCLCLNDNKPCGAVRTADTRD